MKTKLILLLFILLPVIVTAETLRIFPQYWCGEADPSPDAYNKWEATYGSVDITVDTQKSYITMRIGKKHHVFNVLSIDQIAEYSHERVWVIKALNINEERILFQFRMQSHKLKVFMITAHQTLGFLQEN